MSIGHNIRREREKRNWSQDIFAHLTGMSQSNLSNIESNKQDVTWKQIELFAHVLEILPEILVRGDFSAPNQYKQENNASETGSSDKGEQENLSKVFLALSDKIHSQEEEIHFLRQQVQSLTDLLAKKT